MKKDIHPKYMETKIVCGSCGNTVITMGTQPEIHTELCNKCHPFFTGKQVLVDTAGQVDRFQKKIDSAKKIAEKSPKKVVKKVTAAKEEHKEESSEELLKRIKEQLQADAIKKGPKKVVIKDVAEVSDAPPQA